MSLRPSIVRDLEIWNAFEEKPAPRGALSRLVSCRWCTKYADKAVNVTRMREHLEKCQAYLIHPSHVSHEVVRERARTSDPHRAPYNPLFTAEPAPSRQSKLVVNALPIAEVIYLNELASLAIYVGGRPLSFFDEKYLQALINRLNPNFRIPSRQRFSTELLDEAYNKMRALVQNQIDTTDNLNLVIDGSSNINHTRLVNISLHSPLGAFYLESLEMDELKHGGQETADHLDRRIRAWCGDDISRVNSIATDTENTMTSFIDAIHLKPAWRYVFWAPCDSHGLQLLIKHISDIPWFENLFARAQKIVIFFWKANKQLAVLRKHQQRLYQRIFALTMSVVTRWGSQYWLIYSLIRSEAALTAWTQDRTIDRAIGASVIPTIQDPSFWSDLKDLKTILEPLHTAQVRSEDDYAHLGFVLSRWYGIKAHLKAFSTNPGFRNSLHIDSIFRPYQKTVNNKLVWRKAAWKQSFKRQIKPIHHVAYHLDPANRGEGLDDDTQALVFTFLNEYAVGTNDDKSQMRSDFLAFKSQHAPFLRNHYAWNDQKKPCLFWRMCRSISPLLATIAIRIYLTAGNSVASERSFSVNKILHTTPRNRTSVKTMDKLQFIYINARVLSYKLKASPPQPPPPANPPPPNDPDEPNKRRNIGLESLPTNDSWLKLDADTELDLEDEYRPREQDVDDVDETDEFELESEEEQIEEQAKTSNIYSVLQGGG